MVSPSTMAERLRKNIQTDGSICCECATALGGDWPDGHAATCWTGKCSICDREAQPCCAISDRDFPHIRGEKASREF